VEHAKSVKIPLPDIDVSRLLLREAINPSAVRAARHTQATMLGLRVQVRDEGSRSRDDSIGHVCGCSGREPTMIKSEIVVGRKYWCGDGVDRPAILCRVMAIGDDGAVVRRSWGDHGLIGFDKVLAEHRREPCLWYRYRPTFADRR